MFAEVGPTLPPQERAKLHSVLLDNDKVFSDDEGERGEPIYLRCVLTLGASTEEASSEVSSFCCKARDCSEEQKWKTQTKFKYKYT